MTITELRDFGFLIAGLSGVFDNFRDSKKTDQHSDKVQAAHQLRLAEHEAVRAIHQIQTDCCQQQAQAGRDQTFQKIIARYPGDDGQRE
jgi:hypothetical protein